MASITLTPTAPIGVRSRLLALFESFRAVFLDGAPCRRHPGHRVAEDTVGNFGYERLVCSKCFDEGRYDDD